MSSVRRLTWVPPAICGEIAAEVDRVLSGWSGIWGIPMPGPAQCRVLATDATPANDFVDLLAELPASWKQALAHAIFKFDAKGSRLTDAVVQRVVTALQRPLREAVGGDDASADEPVPVGDRGVEVLVEVLGQRCGFVLTCAQLRAARRLASPLPQSLPIVNFEHALVDTPVPLVAELGRATVNVEELMQLAPGDVLVLKESLDTPLRVLAPGSSLALSAHLGAISSPPQRAARWLAS